MSSDLPKKVLEEVKEILDSIKDSRPSKAYNADDTDPNINPKASKCGGGSNGKEEKINAQTIELAQSDKDYCETRCKERK